MEIFSQLVTNGIIAASIYTLVGVGFSLIFSTARFLHFSHGIAFTLGAYLALVLQDWLGLPFVVAAVFSIVGCAVFGGAIECLLYRPLRRKSASPLVCLVASLGVYVVAQNALSLIFGDNSRTIRVGPINEGMLLFGTRITPVQLASIIVCIALVGGLIVFLNVTRSGRIIRAVASDPILAKVSGIDSDAVTVMTFCLGSALAGVAGLFTALDVDMAPTMGMNALIMGVVAAIIGGMGSIRGVALGALLIGLARHLGVWYVGTQWQDAIGFTILLAYLIIHPEGIMGDKLRRAKA